MCQMSCVVIQHSAFEGLGVFAESLNAAGYQVTMVNAAEAGALSNAEQLLLARLA